jgi:UDP-glucuronate decarboxylase
MIPEQDLLDIANGLKNDIFRFEGKTILITGGSGFLGRNFLAFFQFINKNILKKPAKIISVDNYIVGSDIDEKIYDDPNIEIIRHDITQPLKTKLKNSVKIDYIIAAAGIAAPAVYKKYPLETLDVSYSGILNVLELAYQHSVESIITFSSSEVYGTPPDDQIPTPETFIGSCPSMDTRSCYDIGKMVVETLSYIFYTHHDVNVKVIRPFNVYSYAHQSDTRVLPNFIKGVLNNQPLKVYGNNNNTRTFCFITDAIIGFLKVLIKGRAGEIYNIGCDTPEITIPDLARLVKKITNYSGDIIEIPYPNNYPSTEPHRRCPDISKAKKELEYIPTVDLETGIYKFFNWAKENYKS